MGAAVRHYRRSSARAGNRALAHTNTARRTQTITGDMYCLGDDHRISEDHSPSPFFRVHSFMPRQIRRRAPPL